MSVTDADAFRWRGAIDSTVQDHERRLNAINGSIERGNAALHEVREEVVGIKASMRIWGSVVGLIAGIVSPTLVGLIVYFVTKGR